MKWSSCKMFFNLYILLTDNKNFNFIYERNNKGYFQITLQRIIINLLQQPKKQFLSLDFKFMLSLSPFQLYLIENTQQLPLELFHKKNIVRLNVISFQEKNCIRSCNDSHKNIRVPILATLIYLFTQKTQENIQKINKIKDIIYGSFLKNITENKGLTKQSLFLNFAKNINEIIFGIQAENQIIHKINTIPFFDQVIMKAFEQRFQGQKQNIMCQNIASWIKKQLNITIYFKKDVRKSRQNRQNLILLFKDENGQILMETSYCNFLIKNSEQYVTPLKIQKKISAQRVLKSISNDQSECVSPIKHDKNDVCIYTHLKTFDTDTPQKILPTKAQSTMRKTKKLKSSFWAILCCGETN